MIVQMEANIDSLDTMMHSIACNILFEICGVMSGLQHWKSYIHITVISPTLTFFSFFFL